MKNYKWTVFFLVKALDGVISSAMDMTFNLLDVELGEEIAIVLCVNIMKENIPAFLKGDKNVPNPDGDGGTPTVAFFSITSTRDPLGKWNTEMKLIDENADFDLTVADDLQYYFRRVVLAGHQADRYILFTWDHGMSYGIFGAVAADGTTKVLTMDQLSQAIHWGFDGKKIDLLIMMDCYMLMLDTAYALQHAAKFLVAAEDDLNIAGYNYISIFKRITADPGISTKKLAKLAVNSYAKKLFMTKTQADSPLHKATLFACDLDKYHIFSVLLRQFFKEVSDNIVGWKTDVWIAAHGAFPLQGGYHLFDFYTFIQKLDGKLNGRGNVLIELMTEVWDEIVIAQVIGDQVPKAPGFYPRGFSLFLPYHATGNVPSNSSYQPFLNTSFAKDMGVLPIILALATVQ